MKYAIRGDRIPSQNITVVLASETDEPSTLAEKANLESLPKQCISFIPDFSFRRIGCLVFDLRDKFSLESLESLQPFIQTTLSKDSKEIPKEFHTHFYGTITVFNPIRASLYSSQVHEVIQTRTKNTNPGEAVLVFIPESFSNKFKIATPAGPLTPTEIALNVVANVTDKKSLHIFSRYTQFLVSLGSAAIVAWVLYTYPIFLTLLFTLIFSAFLFVVAMISFDKMQFQFPLAAPWISIVSVYLLGLSDRLDKRERRDWAMEQKATSLAKLDELRNNFLSLVSHDLKTPIARMQSVLERLARGEFGSITPLQMDSISKILSASGDLQRTISTLLILGRVEARELRIKREPCDINEILQSCLDLAGPTIKERALKVSTQLEPLFLLDLDKSLIFEVATNLLDNAIKYCPSGSTIEIRSGELSLCPELTPPQDGVWFEIQDNGPGIPKNEREQVFQKFVRGNSELTPSQNSIKGTGLGLYLSRYFVEKHGGVITLYSRTDSELLSPGSPEEQYFSDSPHPTGTIFRVTLPIEAPPETPDSSL